MQIFIGSETRNDKLLCKVMRYVLDGWLETPPSEKELLIFRKSAKHYQLKAIVYCGVSGL